jgi:hypothetical protein
VTAETVRIRLSPANAKQVPGEFNVSGNVIEFFPRLPVKADLSDSGLIPGSTYEIKLPGGHKPNTLENADGDPLAKTYKRSFATAVASSPDLFIDYNPPPIVPKVISVNPKDEAIDVPQSVVPELTFSEPLHPSTVTTSNVTMTMTHRPPGNPLDPQRPIQGHLILEQNRTSVTLKFVADFPLADNATYQLVVDRRVSDLAGNDLEPFESTFTIRDEPPVPGVFTLGFGNGTEVFEDTDVTIASWNDDIPGTLSAIFTAGAGDGTDGDFEPVFNTTLSSDTNEVWNFRVFKVPAGVTVRLVGEKPVTILSLARMEIAGVVMASGSAGDKGETHTYNTNKPPSYGGDGGPGGGDGGDSATTYTKGGDGEDGYNTTGTGAKGPNWPSSYSTYRYVLTGGSGGGHRTAGKKGSKPGYTYYTPPEPGAAGGTDGNATCNPLTGGGGGSSGTMRRYGNYDHNVAGAGGGGGGGLELRSANNIEILGGSVLAKGGDGGAPGNTYVSSPGGGGAGGSIRIRSLKDIVGQNATISVKGGKGHSSGMYTYYSGASGAGGDGWIRFEDGDASPTLSQTTVEPNVSTNGTFTTSGGGAPSVGQTLWLNTGVFDPVFLDYEITQWIPQHVPPAELADTIKVEIQATVEDIFDLGMPDEAGASSWTPIANLTDLNGKQYSFIRFRVTFQLPSNQELDDPMPYVDEIKIMYEF